MSADLRRMRGLTAAITAQAAALPATAEEHMLRDLRLTAMRELTTMRTISAQLRTMVRRSTWITLRCDLHQGRCGWRLRTLDRRFRFYRCPEVRNPYYHGVLQELLATGRFEEVRP